MAIAGWLPCGALLAAASLYLAKDEDAMQAALKRKAHARQSYVDLATLGAREPQHTDSAYSSDILRPNNTLLKP